MKEILSIKLICPFLFIDTSMCVLIYHTKCFKLVGNSRKKARGTEEFRQFCAESGGKLADIYDSNNYEALVDKVRKKRFPMNIHLILGLKYDIFVSQKKLLLMMYTEFLTSNLAWIPYISILVVCGTLTLEQTRLTLQWNQIRLSYPMETRKSYFALHTYQYAALH